MFKQYKNEKKQMYLVNVPFDIDYDCLVFDLADKLWELL